jgi:DUF1009 family protein
MTEGARPHGEVVGVLAGRGDYPAILAERLVRAGKRVAIAGIRGQFSGPAPDGAADFETIPLGAIGRVGRFFSDRGATVAFMAGGVLRRGAWRSVRLDLRALMLLPRALVGGDDGLLRAVADELARLGVEVGDPSSFLDDLFAGEGLLAGPDVDGAVLADIGVARREALELGLADRGQSVVVYRGRVVGREGRAGTDALVAGAPGPGAVLAKAVKPGQDRRFDMPAIGPSTILLAAMVGLRAIAVEAGGVLLLRKERVLELCQERGVSLVGL